MIDECEPEDNTGLLSNLDRMERRKRLFYHVNSHGQTIYEEADRKFSRGLSLSDSMRRAFGKVRGIE